MTPSQSLPTYYDGSSGRMKRADEEPLFGAFFPCERCDGEGENMVGHMPDTWAEPGDPIFEPCTACQGHGTVYVEEGC